MEWNTFLQRLTGMVQFYLSVDKLSRITYVMKMQMYTEMVNDVILKLNRLK